MSDIKIDFVVPWVDGSDPEWQKEFKKYSPDSASCDARFERYRDWDLMRYWFRGVEKNAPWVNKIYFITWGHVPEWLDVNHPKLVIVKHEDYIPAEYLPTFSANPIELNMHRIKGLSEHFVYFNDDFFLIDKVIPEDFFVNGLPCDMAVENVIGGSDYLFNSILMNNISVTNKHFNKRKVIKNNFSKWINSRYKKNLIKTLFLSSWPSFSGIFYSHLPQPFNLSTLFEIWEKEEKLLNYVSSNKFRSQSDVNQYLLKYWQLCKGNFYPYNTNKLGTCFKFGLHDVESISKFITDKTKPVAVLNDGEYSDSTQNSIANAFEQILNDKSSFEK